jgi:hypothetical protein
MRDSPSKALGDGWHLKILGKLVLDGTSRLVLFLA